MLTHPMLDQLTQLGLSGMAQAFAELEASGDVATHVFAAERLHNDDTVVPVLAKGKTDTGRCWVYVRDDRPFGGPAPAAAMFYYSRDRGGKHPQAHLAGYGPASKPKRSIGIGRARMDDRLVLQRDVGGRRRLP